MFFKKEIKELTNDEILEKINELTIKDKIKWQFNNNYCVEGRYKKDKNCFFNLYYNSSNEEDNYFRLRKYYFFL